MISSSHVNPDKLLLPELTEEIPYRPSETSRSLRVVVISSNPKKFEEFRSQLGDGYGMEVVQWQPDKEHDLKDETTMLQLCTRIIQEQATSPHFILREDTSLTSVRTQQDLTELPLTNLVKLKLEPVLHSSSLQVYKPQWHTEKKILSGLTLRYYKKLTRGYIKRDPDVSCRYGFGWDALFLNAAVNLTNEEFFEKYGKKSARQHVISDFIETYLRYKTLKTLKHHSLPLTRPVDFGKNYVSVAKFVREEKHLSNPFISDWGIDKLRDAKIAQGLFFKAALSRVVKLYFSPPFSGLPLTEKKDAAEETIFMTHDQLHHLLCDPICDTDSFFVYWIWRIMSEAWTLILADMFYADGLIKSGVARSCVDKRIYPLFEAIKSTQGIPDPKEMTTADKLIFIKKILFANVRYAVLGDDSEWKKLLRQPNGEISSEHLQILQACKGHFEKFFIGDNVWTKANYDNMQRHQHSLNTWIKDIGSETFRESHVPLLSDICRDLNALGIPLDNHEKLVNPMFEYAFAKMLKPYLERPPIQQESDEILQSRAFRRFLIGQVSLFSRYPVPHNLAHIKDTILARLHDNQLFTNDEQDNIREMLEQYVLGLEGIGLMSREEALNAIDCTAIFPPVYISYPAMQKQYGTIANCVQLCIAKPACSLRDGDTLFVTSTQDKKPFTEVCMQSLQS